MEKQAASLFGEIDRMIEAKARAGDVDLAIPASIVTSLEQNGVAPIELDRIVGSKDEICRLVASDQDLTPDMADRVSRLAHVISLAETIFGKREKAFLWLRTPNPYLNHKSPIDLMDREPGARVVEEALLRIEDGVFA